MSLKTTLGIKTLNQTKICEANKAHVKIYKEKQRRRLRGPGAAQCLVQFLLFEHIAEASDGLDKIGSTANFAAQ